MQKPIMSNSITSAFPSWQRTQLAIEQHDSQDSLQFHIWNVSCKCSYAENLTHSLISYVQLLNICIDNLGKIISVTREWCLDDG